MLTESRKYCRRLATVLVEDEVGENYGGQHARQSNKHCTQELVNARTCLLGELGCVDDDDECAGELLESEERIDNGQWLVNFGSL